jgi:hypothetical protein
MSITSTRTYVRYFGQDQVYDLCVALTDLESDWSGRRLHVDEETREDGDDRLQMAMLAVKRLTDRVP